MPLYALEAVSESRLSDERGAEASDEDSALKDVIRFCFMLSGNSIIDSCLGLQLKLKEE